MASWMMKTLALMLSVVVFSPLALAAGNYDFNDPKSRYQWYTDCRQYIKSKGGVKCGPGHYVEIYKDGHFVAKKHPDFKGTVEQDNACKVSVKDKSFPIPSNSPNQFLVLPIRPGKAKPLSQKDLDSLVFQIKKK